MDAAFLFSVTSVLFLAPMSAGVLWAFRGGRGGLWGLVFSALGGAAGAMIGGLGVAALVPSDGAAFTGAWLGSVVGAAILGMPRPQRRTA